MQNQLILSTGETYTGTIFSPFSTRTPSEMTMDQVFSTSSSAHHAPISSGGSGWVDQPDTGGTSLSNNDAPIGEPWVLLLFGSLYAVWKRVRTKRRLAAALVLLFGCGGLSAGITALRFSPSVATSSETIVINPTISSVPSGTVSVCWGVYYDADCTHEVEDMKFHKAPSEGRNAVSFTAPSAGTYYIRTSLHTGAICDGLLDSYYVSPIHVYPADADVIIAREAQASGTRIDVTDDADKKAYGAMQFSKSALNNEERSIYERFNYFISFPFDVKVGDIYGIGTVGSHWRICYYDGKGRAEEGFFAERPTNWMMIDDTDSVLHAGQGYLLQLNSIQMDADNDEVWANGADVATLYFPALSTFDDITTANETIPALGEAYRCTIDLSASLGAEGDRREKDSYWRCLGVPSFTSPSGVSGFLYLYRWDSSDNSLNVVSSDGFAFAPTHAYLVQSDQEIIWTNVDKPVNAMVRQRGEESFREFRIELQQDGEACDQTFIRLSDDERVTTAFDFGQDLCKEINTGRANVYSIANDERLAANCMPMRDEKISVPIGVQVFSSGSYTFCIPEGTNGIGVTLMDRANDSRTSLSALTYTVELDAGTYDDRFAIEISSSDEILTHSEEAEVRKGETKIRKIVIDGALFIIREGRLYDARGRLIQ